MVKYHIPKNNYPIKASSFQEQVFYFEFAVCLNCLTSIYRYERYKYIHGFKLSLKL